MVYAFEVGRDVKIGVWPPTPLASMSAREFTSAPRSRRKRKA